MAEIALTPIFLKSYQFQDDDGSPLAGGKIYSYIAGLTTPLTLAVDAQGVTAASNPYVLDANGRCADTLFLRNSSAYKLILTTADGPASPTPIPISGVTLATDDGISNPGALGLSNFSALIMTGQAADVTDSFIITDENYISTLSDPSPNPCTIYLPSAASDDAKFPKTIVAKGQTIPTQVVCEGSDTFAGQIGGLLNLPVGTAPMFTGCTIVSDGVSTWNFTAYWEG